MLVMTLSHYNRPVDHDVNCSKSQKRLNTNGQALPMDYQAATLLLEPGKGTLCLQAWDGSCDQFPPVFWRLPDTLRALRPDTPLLALLPPPLHLFLVIRGSHSERRLRRHSRLPVGTLPAARHGTTGTRLAPWAAGTRFAKGMLRPSVRWWLRLPGPFPRCDALAALEARGRKRHRRRPTPNASCSVPRHAPASGLASRQAR